MSEGEEFIEADGTRYVDIPDEDDCLSNYDSEDNEDFVANSEFNEENIVTMMQRDLKGKRNRRLDYGGIQIDVSQVFDTVHEFRRIM